MNEDVKAEWVKRLRDGRPQVKGYLKTPDGQCCLGVLCEIAAEQEVVVAHPLEYDSYENKDLIKYENSSGVLPNKVMEWAGIDSERGNGVKIDDFTLTYYNDSGEDFNQIADRIEKGL